MTLPTVVRVFFAIDLSPATKKEVEIVINGLKKRAKSNGIRWTKPENLHITLQFLGAAKSMDIPNLLESVRSELMGKTMQTEVKLENLQLFPNPYRPRVIVLNVKPQAGLIELSRLIGQGMQALGYELESRPFRGHLTLGRIKYARGIDLDFLSEYQVPEIDKIEIKEVVLFRSEPQPEGSQYTVLDKIGLIWGLTPSLIN